MIQKALLVHLHAKRGREAALEAFLESAAPMVVEEPATVTWFALRFGRADYGIFDAFPDEEGCKTHLSGRVARALEEVADDLLAEPPRIERLSVLASKLPAAMPGDMDTRALLLRFKARDGHEAEVERFLRGAEALVQAEAKTTAWFALDFEDGAYGIFDAFPDNGARFAHITGHVPRELARHALTLIGSFPDMEMASVLAEKIGDRTATRIHVDAALKA